MKLLKVIKKYLFPIIAIAVIFCALTSCGSSSETEETNFAVYIENKSSVAASSISLMIMEDDSVAAFKTAQANDNSFTIVFDKSMINKKNVFKISVLCQTDSGDFTYYDTLSLSENDTTPACYEITGSSTSDLILNRI